MSVLLTIFALVVSLLTSDVISRLLPRVPGSLIQILMGLVLALFTNLQVNLDQEWFLLLFIAPLLFNDGKRFPKQELWELKRPIFENAIFLVFITMFVGGFLIHLLIPGMPLSVSFALAAILSPTDPVAVQSIASRCNLPSNILHLVSGESLINDASGLIGFKYAVAAAVSGQFVLGPAIKDFFYISIVGLIAGAILVYIFLSLRKIFYRLNMKGVAFNTVLQIIAPFLIYFLTEHFFHASGVIAVVTAGIIYHLRNHASDVLEPEVTLVTEKSWDVIIYVLNGIIFLLLGYSLPKATSSIIKEISFHALEPIFYAIITWVILFVIRFLWILFYQRFGSHAQFSKKNLKIDLLSAFSGVRGAITMVGVLSLPYTTHDGSPFPLRDLVLFIASFVIIWSLLAAIVAIPHLTDNPIDSNDNEEQYSFNTAYYYVIQKVIRELQSATLSEDEVSVNWVIWHYQILLHRLNDQLEDDYWVNNQFTLQRIALDSERKEVQRMFRQKEISRDVAVILSRIIDKREADDLALEGRSDGRIDALIRFKNELWGFLNSVKHWLFDQEERESAIQELKHGEIQIYKTAINSIQEYLERDDISQKDFDADSVTMILFYYRSRVQLLESDDSSQNMDHDYYRVQIKSFGMQRRNIQDMLESNQINWQVANQLRQKINYLETNIMNNE